MYFHYNYSLFSCEIGAMKTLLLKAVLLIVLLSAVSCQTNTTNPLNTTNTTLPPPPTNTTYTDPLNTTSNVTFAPPPAINITTAGNFSTTANGTTVRHSKRPQLLIATQISASNTTNATTDFKINFYNSSSTTKFDTYNLTLRGTWTIRARTEQTLSCILVSDGSSFNMLKFDNQARTFDRLLLDPTVTTDWNANIDNNQFSLKENCLGAYVRGALRGFTPPNNLNNTNTTNTTAPPPPVGFINFTVPSGWVPIPTTDSLAYGIANQSIYRLDQNNFGYSFLFALPAAADAYAFRSIPGKLIVAAARRTNPSLNTSIPINVNQVFYVFADPPNGTFRLLGQFDINSTLPTPPANATNSTDPNRLIIPFFTSPTLGKLAVVFSPINNGTVLPRTALLRSIDWAKGTVTALTFADQAKIDATNARLRADNYDFIIGDNFAVIRNQSAYDASTPATSLIVEEAYQYIGTQLVFLRYRNLTAADRTAFKNFFIDSAIAAQLTIITAIDTGSGIEFASFNYGNLASVNKVLPPTIPAYLSFNIPANTALSRPLQGLGWIYKTVAGNITNSTYFRFSPNATGNVVSVTESGIAGSWSVVEGTANERCHMEKEATSGQYRMVLREPVSVTNSSLRITPISLTALLSGATITASTRWFISPNCQRLAVATRMFMMNADRNAFVSMSSTPVMFSAWDQEMNAAIINGNEIWVVNPTTLFPSIVYNHSANPLLPNNNLYRSGNRLLITGSNATAAQFFAYTVDNTTNPWTFNSIINYTCPNFTQPPNIQVSDDLTKVLVFGNSTPRPRFDGFFINYMDQEATNITFPFDKVFQPLTNYIQLYNTFLYIRGRNWDATNVPVELIIFIDKEINPLQASRVNLTQEQATKWRRSTFFPDPNGSFFFLVESEGGTSPNFQVVVMRNQVSVQQAVANSNTNTVPGAAPAVAINSAGQIRLCPPGCSDCSSGSCAGCLTGWSYDSSTEVCMLCGPGCLTCNSPNYQQCLTCIPSTYLTAAKTCQPCDRSCLTCNASAANCLSCPPGTSLIGGTCGGCPRNCITCSNTTSCTVCQNGFVAAGGLCRGCSSSCSSCNPTNITQCTACASGLYLSRSKCIPCGPRCLTCSNSSSCSACIAGYTANSNGTCVLACQSPCLTCVDNQPTQCLSCAAGSTLDNRTCVGDFSCSDTKTCSDCGNGFNKILIAGACIDCDQIQNCIQCSSTDSSMCARCKIGYFVDSDSTCTVCGANCSACTSSSLCTTCSDGFTLASGQDQGQCFACVSPCATCQGSPNYCLSCVDGYTKSSWICQKNKYVQFSFTLNTDPFTFLSSGIDTFIAGLLRVLGENSTNTDAITIASCVEGSTILQGSATPTNDNVTPAAASSMINNAVSSDANAFGIQVKSTSLVVMGQQSSSSQNKTGLIVGLAVGLTFGVAIIVIIIVVVFKMKLAAMAAVGAAPSSDVVVKMNNQHKQVQLSESVMEIKNQKRFEMGIVDA